MKKKLVTICLVVALLLVAAGGTLAYFTADDSASNTFTVGNVKIVLDEAVVEKDGDLWVAGKERTDNNTYENIYPGAVLPKDPTVHNTGKNDAWVRVSVTVSNAGAFADVLGEGVDLSPIVTGHDENSWTLASVKKEGESWTYTYNYKSRLKAGTSTTPIFEAIKIPTNLTSEQMALLGETFTINVFAEAIQAEGFADVEAAFAAYDL